jgi:L-fucose isomerase-like protein
MAKAKLRVGYVGTSIASYFATEYQQRKRAITGLETLADAWGFELIAIADEIMTIEAAEQAAERLRAEQIDFLLLQTAGCSIGEQILPLARVAPRMGLWATPEPHSDGDIKLHSFVSMSHFASILVQTLESEHIPFKWFYGHVETEEFQRPFGISVRALTAVKNMRQARIGWFGGLAPGFINMRFDTERLRDKLGVTVWRHELSDLIERAKGYDPEPVTQTSKEIYAAASAVRVSESAAFDRVTRLYLAMRDTVNEHGYDALAVSCWSEFQESFRIAPCMAYSWMGSEDGVAVSCEGDVYGAISMYLLNLLTGAHGSSTLLDMAVIDTVNPAALMWHCGVSPRHFANKDGIQWVDHVTLGRKSPNVYGVAGDQVFAANPATISYLSRSGDQLLVVGAEIVERENPGYAGTRGWFTNFTLNREPVTLHDLVHTLTSGGHPHHYAVGISDVTRELIEFASWTGIQRIVKRTYTDYLQLPL